MGNEGILSSSPVNQGEDLEGIRPLSCRLRPYDIDTPCEFPLRRADSDYTSFPSFDTWDTDQQEKEGPDIKTP